MSEGVAELILRFALAAQHTDQSGRFQGLEPFGQRVGHHLTAMAIVDEVGGERAQPSRPLSTGLRRARRLGNKAWRARARWLRRFFSRRLSSAIVWVVPSTRNNGS